MSSRANEAARELEELEDRLDAALMDLARMEQANEEHLLWSMVKRCHEGEAPLRVWREHRALSQQALAEAADVPIDVINEIEGGSDTVSLRSLAALARALDADLDDLVPWRED